MSCKEDYLVILWEEETQEGGRRTPRKCGNSLKNNLGQFGSPIEDNKKMKKKKVHVCVFLFTILSPEIRAVPGMR